MAFEKSFDDILNDILTDVQNQLPEADISQGSLIFVKSAALASGLWGLYKYLDYISDQIFPDTADTANLEHHAWLRAINRTANETDGAMLSRLLAIIRRPPAGGNRYDYVQWALSIDDVAGAWCFPLARGDGTVDVVIMSNLANTGSEIPTQTLMDTVKAYIDDVRPVGAGNTSVQIIAPVIDTQAITMTVTGAAADLNAIAAEIAIFIAALVPDQVLYRSQLLAIAVNNGAINATITLPSADVTPATHHMLRPGAISVTAA